MLIQLLSHSGKAAHRLEHYPQKPDELGFSWFNGQCCFLAGAGLVGFHWLPIWLQRQDQRSKFGISGNFITDCLAACCLPCCAVAQQELDVKERAEVEPLNGKGGYGKAAEGMQYTPPQ